MSSTHFFFFSIVVFKMQYHAALKISDPEDESDITWTEIDAELLLPPHHSRTSSIINALQLELRSLGFLPYSLLYHYTYLCEDIYMHAGKAN